jgi:hypothetical protein
MGTVVEHHHLSEEDYLATEDAAPMKREYVRGRCSAARRHLAGTNARGGRRGQNRMRGPGRRARWKTCTRMPVCCRRGVDRRLDLPPGVNSGWKHP